MFRFTTRELLGLVAVAAISCVMGSTTRPAEMDKIVGVTLIAFALSGSSYVLGVWAGRGGSSP